MSDHQLILTFLKDYQESYKDVVKYCKVIESEKGSFPSVGILETRGITYHLFKAVEEGQNVNDHVTEAKGHLIRCSLDVASILIEHYISSVGNIISRYKVTTVLSILPEYSKIKAKLSDAQDLVHQFASERDNTADLFKNNIKNLWYLVEMVRNSRNKIKAIEADFINFESEKKQEKKEVERANDKQLLKNRLSAFVLGILAGILINYFKNIQK